MWSFIVALLATLITLGFGKSAQAGTAELRLLTSFPESFYAPFVEVFEARHPGISVRVQNKHTNAGLDEILRGNPRRFDLYWASSPEAFALLETAQDGIALVAPSREFALAGMGWAYRKDLENPPKRLEDLLDPRFKGRISMARPARSGTNHMFVEQVLQRYGWREGWAFLLEFAGNLETIVPRSFTVLEGVSDGRFDIGVSIDFLATSDVLPNLDFTYGDAPIVTGARIAALAGGDHPDGAGAFIGFVRSPTAQRLLLRPETSRIPIDPVIRAEMLETLEPGFRKALAARGDHGYDAHVSAGRYWGTNALFDAFIALPLDRRKALWARLAALEARGIAAPEARAELTRMPVRAEEVTLDPALPLGATRFTTLSQMQRSLAAAWERAAEDRLDAVEAMLARIEAKHQ